MDKDKDKLSGKQGVSPDLGLLGRTHPLPGQEKKDNKQKSSAKRLSPKSKVAASQQEQPSREERRKRQNKQKTRHNHRGLKILAVVVVLLVIFCGVGQYQFGKSRQIAALTSNLDRPQVACTDIYQGQHEKVSPARLQPLQLYFARHKRAFRQVKKDLAKSGQADGLKLIQSGRHWGIFPAYNLQVKTYPVQVKSSHSLTTLTINHQVLTTHKKGKAYCAQASLLPGSYQIIGRGKQGRKLKKVDVLGPTKVQLSFKTNKAVKPQKVKTKPKKRGRVKKASSLKQLLYRAFVNPQVNNFIGGKGNADYRTLRQMKNSWGKNTKVKIKLGQRRPLNQGWQFDYQVLYHFKSGARQTMDYDNAFAVKKKGHWRLQRIGSGALDNN